MGGGLAWGMKGVFCPEGVGESQTDFQDHHNTAPPLSFERDVRISRVLPFQVSEMFVRHPWVRCLLEA